ncbi:MAG: hypothetical protein JJT94_16080 [Bernardetiaceae bacterium]|nr:hypothetical protein [Bernardetiaceae bacterium]
MQTKIVYQNEYWTIYHDEKNAMIIPVWNSTSSSLTNDLYKIEMQNYAAVVEKYTPKQLLIDCRDLYFAIAPEVQDWTNITIFPIVFAAGVRNVAVILPKEFIANLSIEQVMEEVEGTKFFTRYFGTQDKAKEWLFSLS